MSDFQLSTNQRGFRSLVAAVFFLLPLAATAAIELTDEEKQYLAQHPVLTMCVDPDWRPFEYLDDNNNYTGVIAEYMKIIEENIGTRFEVVHTDSWAQSKEFAEQRKCDFIPGANLTEEREEYLGFTTPYFRIDSGLAFRKSDSTRIKSIDDLRGKQLVVVGGNLYDEAVALDYPDIRLLHVDDPDDGLFMVSEGKADAIIGALYNLEYSIKRDGITNLTTLKNRKYKSIIRIGVRNDAPELYLIMNKAVKSLAAKDHLSIRDQMLKEINN